MIEKLKCSIQLLENEKRDIEVIIDMQKFKYEKREIELLARIEVNTNQYIILSFVLLFLLFFRKQKKN